MFRITDYIDFTSRGHAHCPSCEQDGKKRRPSLVLVPNTDGAYKCHRGCTPQMIREAIGVPKDKLVPTALATSRDVTTVAPQKVREAHDRLMQPSGEVARQWLIDRGITEPMMARYQLGLVRSKQGDRMVAAISIPIPADRDGTKLWQKKRIEPWLPESDQPPNYIPWSQKGIPAKVWFTWLPAAAAETWICEGEWDAMMLGWAARQAELPVAVASFTCGCSAVPSDEELALLPGEVKIFYDRQDKPNKQGVRPGEHGAQKLAKALGSRGKIALVPMPEGCSVAGWDVTDAIGHGFSLEDFIAAANAATVNKDAPVRRENYLREHLQWNDELLDTAPEYTDWLVPDLLTTSELFLLAAGPRAGKSLLAMTLAKAVAEGSTFLGRPVLQGPVLYIRKEDNDTKTKEREIAQGWSRGLPVAWLRKFKLSELDLLQDIAEEIQPRLIVIDTLSRVKDASVSESSAEMSQLLEPLQELSEELDCCILLVHHTGKINIDNAGQIDIFDTIRGSSAIRATCRGSLILAAGERNYRLLAENGWGKHDLNVMLDADTLTWRLIGEWKPTCDGTQSDQVIEYLKNRESATIDQMSIDLNVPKRSLYIVLERLQASEIAGEKVVKKGRRRSYTYALALFHQSESLFNNTGLLNSVLNSANPDSESDTRTYSTKTNFFPPPSGSIIDQTGTSPDCDTLIDPEADFSNTLLNKGAKTGSNALPVGVSPIQQLDNSIQQNAANPDTASNPLFNSLINNLISASQVAQTPERGTPIIVSLALGQSEPATFVRESPRMRRSAASQKLEIAWCVELAHKKAATVTVDCIWLEG